MAEIETGSTAVTIPVTTESGRYAVAIGSGLLGQIPSALHALPGHISRVFAVTSPEIDALWGEPLRGPLQTAGFSIHTLPIPAGEAHKRLPTVERLCEELAAHGADRDALLIALGGGVIGDITGFVAAVYMRGVRFVQVPTTLLAQVDSSVGGKTGVNLGAGKNLVGSFHQPVAVFADIDTLRTLPARELRAGLQESVKAAIIRDAELFSYMERHADAILAGDARHLQHVVEASVRIKADVVARDERESGLRAILNFGHTLGHALEAATGYTQLLHGEAIGCGMLAALRLAVARGALDLREADRMGALVRRYGPESYLSYQATAERLVELTASDKKMRSGTLSFILPLGIGRVEIVKDVTRDELLKAAHWMMRTTAGDLSVLDGLGHHE